MASNPFESSGPTAYGGGRVRYTEQEPRENRLIIDYVDAKVALAKREIMHELDTKITEIEGKLTGLPQASTIWKAAATIVAGTFTAVGFIFAILSWTGDRVDGAASASSAFNDQIVESKMADEEQEKAIESVNQKLDLLIAAGSQK
tara:strand:- start:56693 stop:57130 length:438 start_codon:yes stop_codon:yes gene_type:complete